MIQRFQIEDLIAQDPSGVVFRALDTQTGQPVAVRRFFPFGADGGGLHADEQSAYLTAIERLAGLRHPALRSVICGGCDPVDGMPYIVTEWIEGESLQWFIEQEPLVLEVAAELIDQALAVSELLSQVFAEEAVWVETELPMINFGGGQSDRRFIFWISPLKWLGGHEKSRGLESIITLAGEITGWKYRGVTCQADQGIGAWLTWLRGAAATTTTSLHEARAMLAVAMGVQPPPAATRRRQNQARRPGSSGMFWVLGMVIVLGVAGLVEWHLIRKRVRQASAPPLVLVPSVSPRQKQGSAFPEKGNPSDRHAADSNTAAILASQRKAAEANGGVIFWQSRELLVQNRGKEVVVEGVFEKIGYSDSEKTLYLQFSKQPGPNDARGAVASNPATPDLSEQALRKLIGKKIRLHGKVEIIKVSGLERPDIKIKDRASIQVIE